MAPVVIHWCKPIIIGAELFVIWPQYFFLMWDVLWSITIHQSRFTCLCSYHWSIIVVGCTTWYSHSICCTPFLECIELVAIIKIPSISLINLLMPSILATKWWIMESGCSSDLYGWMPAETLFFSSQVVQLVFFFLGCLCIAWDLRYFGPILLSAPHWGQVKITIILVLNFSIEGWCCGL